ncbi:putative dipeptidase MCYG_02918 isoform X1 [Harmonia axyridis]|uniref:putative dipeptidase MCYG_02918 isoform X1 n=1 Tax=Harmonia axyridis TaxID=115357 RepID=UPI001E27981F|nr:putative dipeptidase MCYG_02918 isoform X1 [Harmonia axyridis]XP_045470490.1 putative dipeptidase MCYG_02918 isoform X1 [Harmonia axyridis]
MLPDGKSRCPSLAPLLHPQRRKYLYGGIGVFVLIMVVILAVYLFTSSGSETFVLDRTPLFAGRNNLAQNLDLLLNDNLTMVNFNLDLSNDTIFGKENCTQCNTDFIRLRKGKVSSQFWVARAGCKENTKITDTVKQLDVISRMVQNYSDYLQLVRTSNDLEDAYENKKLGSIMFIDGGQSLMESTAFLRSFYYMGVRAMTLASGCDNSTMDYSIDKNGSLTDFGKMCIEEMNRLGMMIDIQGLSNTSQQEILNISRAPVLISNAAASDVFKYSGNIDNETLSLLKSKNGLLMITFDAPNLGQDENNVSISNVIKHLNYITDEIGFDNIAIGGNYDSMYKKPKDLEDVSDFPELFRQLKKDQPSKWNIDNLDKLAGLNFKRFFKNVELAKNQ